MVINITTNSANHKKAVNKSNWYKAKNKPKKTTKIKK
jgi:hypothetical protein